MAKITEDRIKEIQRAVEEYTAGESVTNICKNYHIDRMDFYKYVVDSGQRVRTRAESLSLAFGTNPAFEKDDGSWFKICSKCSQEKPTSSYKKDKEYTDGYVSECNECKNDRRRPLCKQRYWGDPEYRKQCQEQSKKFHCNNPEIARNWHTASKYKMTQEEFEQKLANQGGVCAACGKDDPGRKDRTWCIDHDHACCPDKKKTCGKCVRGLLCHPCNFILGLAKDNPETLKGLIDYLACYQPYPGE